MTISPSIPATEKNTAVDRDAELIIAWHGNEPLPELGKRFGVTPWSIRAAFRRLAKEGRVPQEQRKHRIFQNKRVLLGDDEPVTVKRDNLLARLIRVHGGHDNA